MQAARMISRAGVAARAAAPAMRAVAQPVRTTTVRKYTGRAPDGLLEQAYHVVLKKNINFIMFILAGAIVVEGVWGSMGNALWHTVNGGVSTVATTCGNAAWRILTAEHVPFRVAPRRPSRCPR